MQLDASNQLVRLQFEDAVSVSFAYHLVGSGWAECTIAVDEQHATMTASYLSDAFGDLLGAVIRMVDGQPEATASFAEEPGEYRWRVAGGGWRDKIDPQSLHTPPSTLMRLGQLLREGTM
jgi:hypothetical protein